MNLTFWRVCTAILLLTLFSVGCADSLPPQSSLPSQKPATALETTPLESLQTVSLDSRVELPPIGEKVASFSFVDLRYLSRTLDEFGEKKATVIVFTNLDCPIGKRFLPRLKKLDEEYRDRGVQFLSLNVGPEESVVDVAAQALRADIAFPFCKDFDGAAARALGVTRTPEVVVLDADKRLVYRGRIDASIRFAGVSPKKVREDLKEALEDVLAGREVSVKETPVDGCLISFPKEKKPTATNVTFSEQIAPLMQEHCQNCHRPGTETPFSLITYDDVVTHAEMVGEVVLQQRMPPWFACEQGGEIVNRQVMSSAERQLIADWVAADTPEGDRSKLPEPIDFPDLDWQIGKPDLLIKMASEEKIPADGYIPYRYVTLPYVFFHDTWVQQVEIMPGNRNVVHHCNMAYITLEDGKPQDHFITGFVPGGTALIMDEGTAFLIPAGSVLILQLHYISLGKEATDQTSVGFVFPKGPVHKQLNHFLVKNTTFAIPPGATHHKVVAEKTLDSAATGLGMFTHMHLRGKDMTFLAHYPDGEEETLLTVPNYSFDWQLGYRWQKGKKKFPAGTRIECIAHYDNSEFNPYNPAPDKVVKEGPQTFHEMMYGFFFYTKDGEELNLTVDPKTGYAVENSANAEDPAEKDTAKHAQVLQR